MKDFEKLKKTSIEDLQKEISAEIDYFLRRAASCYEGDNAEEVSDELGTFFEEIEPIIFEKLKEAYFVGMFKGIGLGLKSAKPKRKRMSKTKK